MERKMKSFAKYITEGENTKPFAHAENPSNGYFSEAIIQKIIADNPSQAEQYRAGKDKLLTFFIGQTMKATRGKANPKQVNSLIKEYLS